MFSNFVLAVAIVFIAGALMGTPEEVKRKRWVDYALAFGLFGLIDIRGANALTSDCDVGHNKLSNVVLCRKLINVTTKSNRGKKNDRQRNYRSFAEQTQRECRRELLPERSRNAHL